jgi:hypothetical protein
LTNFGYHGEIANAWERSLDGRECKA